ncbi:MAG TPA: response regulator transcription factor [Terriglobales bacterium]|nr:response regulator transcription factor [Terriglobales bacterium]
MTTRILIADDDAPVRQLLRRILEEHPGWLVCGEASNGRDAVAKAKQLSPDVVVMDLAMPQMNGLEAGREISKSSHLHMLLLTVQEVSQELAREARKAGFQGAISKGKGTEVIPEIETLLEDGTCSNRAQISLPSGPRPNG